MESEAKNLCKQAKDDMVQKDYEKAIDRLERALGIFRDLKKEKEVTKTAQDLVKAYEKQAVVVNKIGDELYKQKKYEEAIKYYQNSVEIVTKSNDKKNIDNYKKELQKTYEKFAMDINKQADQLKKEKKFPEAIEIYSKSVNLMEKAYNTEKADEFKKELTQTASLYAKDINKQADKEFKQKNYQKSLELYEKSLENAQKSQDQKLITDFTKELYKNYEALAKELEQSAENAIEEGNYDDALNKLGNALNFIKKTNDQKKIDQMEKKVSKVFETHAENINQAGDEAFKKEDYPKAIEIYHNSLEMAKKSKNNKLISNYDTELDKTFEKYAEIVNEKGDEALKAKNYEEAENIYRDSVKLAKESQKESLVDNYSGELKKTLETWSKTYQDTASKALKAGTFDKAVSDFEKALEIIKRTEDEDEIKEYNKDLIDAYEKWADKLNKDGDLAFDSKKYQQAVDLYSKACGLIEKTKDEEKIKKLAKDRDKAVKKLT